jgi:hypothetical protein
MQTNALDPDVLAVVVVPWAEFPFAIPGFLLLSFWAFRSDVAFLSKGATG